MRWMGVEGLGMDVAVVVLLKRTRWRTRFGFDVSWRASLISRVGCGGEVDAVDSAAEGFPSSPSPARIAMVPSSEGWPPP